MGVHAVSKKQYKSLGKELRVHESVQAKFQIDEIPHQQGAFPIPPVYNQNWHQEGLEHLDLGSSVEDKREADHSADKLCIDLS